MEELRSGSVGDEVKRAGEAHTNEAEERHAVVDVDSNNPRDEAVSQLENDGDGSMKKRNASKDSIAESAVANDSPERKRFKEETPNGPGGGSPRATLTSVIASTTAKPPPKLDIGGETSNDLATSHADVWEMGIFPFLKTKVLLTTVRAVNRSFRRRATSFLILRRILDGTVHKRRAKIDGMGLENRSRRITLLVRRSHSKDFVSREALIERGVLDFENHYVGENRSFITRESHRIRRALETTGRASYGDRCRYLTTISFDSSTDLSDTPFNCCGSDIREFSLDRSGGFPEVLWGARRYDNGKKQVVSKLLGRGALILGKCVQLLLREAVPSKSFAPRLATHKFVVRGAPRDAEMGVKYSGTEHFLQFKISSPNGDAMEEIPVELYILGEIVQRRGFGDFRIDPI